MNENQTNNSSLRSSILALVFDLPWFELIGRIWKVGRQIVRGLSSEGTYEVLDYECQVELNDSNGKDATIQKREKVLYLQDYITSYQDQAWGNGDILLHYECSPGIPVDQYQLGHNTYKLISLREFRNRGDIDEFNIKWNMKNGFLKRSGFWGTAINQRTKHITVRVIFPKNRPPTHISIFEKNLQRTRILGNDVQQRLPDGRYMLIWEKPDPRLYEDYILGWEW